MEVYLPEEKIKERKFWQKLKISLWGLAFIAALAVFTYWLAASSFWQVKKITVEGLDGLPSEVFLQDTRDLVGKRLIGKLLGSSHFLSWPQGSFLENSQPQIASFYISKNWLKRSIIIAVEKRERAGVWCFRSGGSPQAGGQNCYWFDKEGVLIEEAPRPEGNLIITIDENNDYSAEIGDGVLEKMFWQIIFKIINFLEQNNFSVSHIQVDRERLELTVGLNSSADILFSLEFDPGVSLNALLQFEKKQGNLDLLDYVDLRVENKLYYK